MPSFEENVKSALSWTKYATYLKIGEEGVEGREEASREEERGGETRESREDGECSR